MKPHEILDRLVALGCQESQKMKAFGRWVSFDPMDRIKKADLPEFARLVRAAAMMERGGHLIADIDRMGRVIGWHVPTGPKQKPKMTKVQDAETPFDTGVTR